MNQKQRKPSIQTLMGTRGAVKAARPLPRVTTSSKDLLRSMGTDEETVITLLSHDLKPVKEEPKQEAEEIPEDEASALVKSEIERFIEISKHFSSPLRRTASYICENRLVSYPNPFRIEYKRGGVTTEHLKFSNLTLEPVYIKLYKLVPDLEQMKYINLNLSRSKRIPPGLSFNLGFVYDDVEEKACCNSKMIVVAHRKTSTPCYQICEIDLMIEPLKVKPNISN